MANQKPLPAPLAVQFKPGWLTGKTKLVRIPKALEKEIRSIAKCLDRNPQIAESVLAYAQSLVE